MSDPTEVDLSFHKESGESKKPNTKRRNVVVIVGVGLFTAGVVLAVVLPLCINNDCSGLLGTSTTTTTQATHPTATTTPATARTSVTTTTRPSTTTTTVTTTPPTSPTSTSSTRRFTLPTLTPPSTQPTSPPQFVPRDLTVNPPVGPIVGHEVVLNLDTMNSQHSRIASWTGIPFAEPPVGDLRWKKPVSVTPWTTPLVANRQTPLCVQSGGTVHSTHPAWEDFQEDCLYLHVYAPMDTSQQPYPVMVWIFGGSFQSGGNVQYPGHFLASKGVIVVTINYRLNIMGFASTADGTTPGNFGLWDQREAILWVENNIAAFGGDAKQITVFGESAGAASTGLVVASPQNKGHFQQAIMESGSDYAIWAVNAPETLPETYIYQVAAPFQCTVETSSGAVTNDEEMMDCLRSVDAETLRRANFDCPFCLGFAPVVDGPGGYLPETPVNLRNSRQASEVPIMHGHNSNECSIGLIGEDSTLILRGVNRTEFEAAMRAAVNYFEYAITEPDADLPDDLYQSANWFYSPWPTVDNGELNKLGLSYACLDVAFAGTANDQLRHHSRYSTSYRYMFGFDPKPTFPPAALIPSWIGVPHAVELAYVWGYVFLGENPDVAADNGNLTLDLGIPLVFSQTDKDYADFTMTLWTNFAKYGDPTPDPIQPPGSTEQVKWEPFTEDQQNYFHMVNEGTSTRQDYRALEAAYFNNYINGMARGSDYHNPKGIPDWPLSNNTLASTIQDISKNNARRQRGKPAADTEKRKGGLISAFNKELDFPALRQTVRKYFVDNLVRGVNSQK